MQKFCDGCIYSLNLTNACWMVAIECKKYYYTILKGEKISHRAITEISKLFRDKYCRCSNCIIRPVCENRLDKTRTCLFLDEGFEKFRLKIPELVIKKMGR